MSTTSTRTHRPTTSPTQTRLLPGAVLGGLAAAAATTALAALADASGVSLEVSGEPIPALGFAVLTLVFSAVGLLIALGLRRWAAAPRQAWIRTTVVLTALSLVPDVLADAAVETKLLLMATHLLAAAIVVPVVASRLPRG